MTTLILIDETLILLLYMLSSLSCFFLVSGHRLPQMFEVQSEGGMDRLTRWQIVPGQLSTQLTNPNVSFVDISG